MTSSYPHCQHKNGTWVEVETNSHKEFQSVEVASIFLLEKQHLLSGFWSVPCNKRNASSIIVSCLWWTFKLIFQFGIFSKKCWALCVVSMLIGSIIWGVMESSKYSGSLLGCANPIFVSGWPLNGKWGCSPLTFAHAPHFFLLSCALSEVLLCLLPDRDFVMISLSFLNSRRMNTDFYLLSIFHDISASSYLHTFTRLYHGFDKDTNWGQYSVTRHLLTIITSNREDLRT